MRSKKKVHDQATYCLRGFAPRCHGSISQKRLVFATGINRKNVKMLAWLLQDPAPYAAFELT